MDEDFAGGGAVDAGDEVQQGGLAGAGGAHEGEEFAFVDGDVQFLEDGDADLFAAVFLVDGDAVRSRANQTWGACLRGRGVSRKKIGVPPERERAGGVNELSRRRRGSFGPALAGDWAMSDAGRGGKREPRGGRSLGHLDELTLAEGGAGVEDDLVAGIEARFDTGQTIGGEDRLDGTFLDDALGVDHPGVEEAGLLHDGGLGSEESRV